MWPQTCEYEVNNLFSDIELCRYFCSDLKPNYLFMKKILSAIIALYLIVPSARAQDDEIRPKAIGVSFFVNEQAIW